MNGDSGDVTPCIFLWTSGGNESEFDQKIKRDVSLLYSKRSAGNESLLNLVLDLDLYQNWTGLNTSNYLSQD